MNLRDLKYLVALVDHKHFGKAAKACFVSQPALSMQIKKLEDTLGIQLIERKNKTVLLTQIGESIAEHARDILHRVTSMQETAKQAKDPFSGELTLGVIPTLAPYLLPHIIPGLNKLFPKLTIYLIEEQTANLLTQLKLGKLDAALLALPLQKEDLISLPLFNEEFVLAVSTQHSLAKRKFIKPRDIEDKAILLLTDGHCMREQALAFCHKADAMETKSFRATSLETLRHMVASNVGITLMPKLAYRQFDGISYLPFSLPKPTRTIGLVCRPTTTKKIVLNTLGEQIKKLLNANKAVQVI